MVCRTTSINRRSVGARAGFLLSEFLVTFGITTMLFLTIAAVAVFSGKNFVALANYVELDDHNRIAIDTLTRDLRQCKQVTGSTSTSLTIEDSDGTTIAYNYNPDPQLFTRAHLGASRVLLRECDRLNFWLGQRNPVGGSYDVYPAATPATAKVVNVAWSCSRTILGQKQNTESVQTARIVIRKQGT